MKAEQSVIKRQAREIQRLRRENARLSRIAYESSDRENTDNGTLRLFSELCASQRSMNVTNYPKYIYKGIKDSSAYGIWMRILTYFRRFRLASTIIRVSTWIITLVQSSAVFIVSTAIFVVMIPALIVAALAMGIAALTHGASLNRKFASLVQNKKIYIFFPPASHRAEQYSFIRVTAEQLAENKDNFIFIVSPHFVSSHILGDKRLYMTSKQLSDNIYCIRKHYYFTLRKKVLSSLSDNTRYIF